MRTTILLLLALILVSACGTHGTDPSSGTSANIHDTDWIGETRITAGDTDMRLCGTGKRYRITGPAIDTIYRRYHAVNATAGQWMKLWITGHLCVIGEHGLTDSAIYAATFLHLDGALHCDPVPDPRIAGSYRLDITDPIRTRSMRLELFLEGDATLFSDLHDGHGAYEEDGSWGIDGDDHVKVLFKQREQTMIYRFANDRLATDMAGPGDGLIFDRTGAPDRLQGAFGRTARWLAAIATSQGKKVNADDLKPTTTLKELFTSDQARDALRASARDTLGLDDTSLRLEWGAVATVHDAIALMRMRIRSTH